MTTTSPKSLVSKDLNYPFGLYGFRVWILFCSTDSKSLQTNSWGSLSCGFTALRRFLSLRVSLYVRTNVSYFLHNNQHRANHSILLTLPLPLLILPTKSHKPKHTCAKWKVKNKKYYAHTNSLFLWCGRTNNIISLKLLSPKQLLCQVCSKPHAVFILRGPHAYFTPWCDFCRSFVSLSCQRLHFGNIILNPHAHAVRRTALIMEVQENLPKNCSFHNVS